jgi:RNA polymerase sigma-B factor
MISKDTEGLIAELKRTGDERLRAQIIERHTPLVRALSHKFARLGVAEEDLRQIAWVALIEALDRFDPMREARFVTYATHWIAGTIKRYFRDRTWGMRVPRRLQEIARSLPSVRNKLAQQLGREPTMAEMAAAFGTNEETLAEAMELQRDYQLVPLEGDEGAAAGDQLGREDARLRAIIEHAPLHAALAQLGTREQLILRRRFYEGYSQAEIAAELGVSQMHVSRLERGALRQLLRMLRENAAEREVERRKPNGCAGGTAGSA